MSFAHVLTKEYLLSEHYDKGLSLNQLARNVGCGPATVKSYLIKHGLETQRRQHNQYGRKYKYDDNFFEVINTEEKAYWLGFIMADGYTLHRKKQKRLRIALSRKDECHLHKFIKSIKSNVSVKYDGVNPYVDINCTKMCNDLASHGVIPNKSNHEIIPILSEHLHRHFIRGLFDGDGSWVLMKYTNSEVMKFTLLSSFNALSNIKTIMEAHDIIFPKVSIFERKGIWCLQCHKREDVLKIIEFMYNDATLFLDRKYRQAVDFVNYKSKRLTKSTAEEIRILYATGMYSHSQLGKMFHTSRSNIGVIVNYKSFV